MRIKINQLLFLICLFCSIIFTGCQKWDDHNDVTDPALNLNLFEQIKGNANLSKFAELLTKSGYDKVLASSRTFTVFAPTNTALANLDAATIADSAKLSAFIGNHVTTQTYFTYGAATQLRLKMLNGKYQNMLNKTIEEANIVEADKYAKNGVVQVIDKIIPVLSNGWEALQTNTSIPAMQKNYMISLVQKIFDPANALQIGVNPLTGEPIYKDGTDSVTTNKFWRNVYDLKDESKQFTLFVLTDAAWTSEVNKFKPFFATSTADSTTDLSSWAVVKDLAIEGKYAATATTDTVMSKFGVKVPVDKAAIVSTIKTSNGVIYVMNKVDVQPKHKILPIIIEGENYTSSFGPVNKVDKRSVTYFRDRLNSLTGKIFRDVSVVNHSIAQFNLYYRVNNVYSGVKYKAYWVAVNDFNLQRDTVKKVDTIAYFSQKLAFGAYNATTFATAQNTTGYTVVKANEFREVLIGEVTLPTYKPVLDVYLTAANSSSAAVSPLVCDYIRLEPQL